MKILKYKDESEWLKGRIGRITGSKLKDIVVKRGTTKKIGSYQLIADRLGIPADDEKPIDRGHRLEKEAIAKFIKETGKKNVDDSLVIWVREDNPNIAYSPDAFIGTKECVEIKCLGSARHIEALITNEIPSEFEFQKLQSFIVNDELETLYFTFYDPRLLAKPFFYITVTRDQVKDDIELYRAYQENELMWVNEWVNKLSGF
jgi:hypothetical protein